MGFANINLHKYIIMILLHFHIFLEEFLVLLFYHSMEFFID